MLTIQVKFRQRNALESGVWVLAPSLFRLRLVGSGSIVIDARSALGVVTAAIASYSASNATDQIKFPYLGDAAVALRATFPNTMTVEVL